MQCYANMLIPHKPTRTVKSTHPNIVKNSVLKIKFMDFIFYCKMLKYCIRQPAVTSTKQTYCWGGRDFLNGRFISESVRMPRLRSSLIASICRYFMMCCLPRVQIWKYKWILIRFWQRSVVQKIQLVAHTSVFQLASSTWKICHSFAKILNITYTIPITRSIQYLF